MLLQLVKFAAVGVVVCQAKSTVGAVTVTVLVLISVQLFGAAKPLFQVYVIVCVPAPAREGLKNPIPRSLVKLFIPVGS